MVATSSTDDVAVTSGSGSDDCISGIDDAAVISGSGGGG